MKLYLDDVRYPPDNTWQLCRTPGEVIFTIKSRKVDIISLDHDLGSPEEVYGTGYDVLKWIEQAVVEECFKPPFILIHTANPVARARMYAALIKIWELYEINDCANGHAGSTVANEPRSSA